MIYVDYSGYYTCWQDCNACGGVSCLILADHDVMFASYLAVLVDMRGLLMVVMSWSKTLAIVFLELIVWLPVLIYWLFMSTFNLMFGYKRTDYSVYSYTPVGLACTTAKEWVGKLEWFGFMIAHDFTYITWFKMCARGVWIFHSVFVYYTHSCRLVAVI